MIDFHPPKLEDKPWVDALLKQADYRGCDYNFTTLFTWGQAYRMEIAQAEGFFLTRLCGRMGCSYLYPAGTGDLDRVLQVLEADALERGAPLRLVCVTPGQMADLEDRFPGGFTFTGDRDGYEYLYEIDRLADLGGKKLHAKRNHINRFMERYPGWRFEEITPESLPECLEMDKEW